MWDIRFLTLVEGSSHLQWGHYPQVENLCSKDGQVIVSWGVGVLHLVTVSYSLCQFMEDEGLFAILLKETLKSQFFVSCAK